MMLRKLVQTGSSWAMVPLRLALGIAFMGHGLQKVLGTFNGPGWAKWTSWSQADKSFAICDLGLSIAFLTRLSN